MKGIDHPSHQKHLEARLVDRLEVQPAWKAFLMPQNTEVAEPGPSPLPFVQPSYPCVWWGRKSVGTEKDVLYKTLPGAPCDAVLPAYLYTSLYLHYHRCIKK